MTTVIYFFLMAVTLFVVPQLAVKVLTKEPKLNSSLIYLVFAGALPLFWVLFPREIMEIREVNFLQHAVGGGVAVAFVSIYLIKNLKDAFPLLKKFPVQIVFLYAVVSMLGVANELLEFLLDVFEIGYFSSDRYDSWYDLLANTSGAFALFFLYYIIIGWRDNRE